MARGKKQDINTGNGSSGSIPILAGGASDHTAGVSKPSQMPTKNAPGSTKPVSLAEALSLLQTLCLDLRSLGCEIAIPARGKRLYMILAVPPDTGDLTFSEGHIRIGGVPVSDL